MNRQKVFDKYGGRCAYCGCEIKLAEMTIDHIVPKQDFRGVVFVNYQKILKPNDFSNLNPCCQDCNNFKGGCNIDQFRSRLLCCHETIKQLYYKGLWKKYHIKITNNFDGKFYFEKQIL